jgi:hypothetical protein
MSGIYQSPEETERTKVGEESGFEQLLQEVWFLPIAGSVGGLLVVGALALAVFIVIRRKKKRTAEKLDDVIITHFQFFFFFPIPSLTAVFLIWWLSRGK